MHPSLEGELACPRLGPLDKQSNPAQLGSAWLERLTRKLNPSSASTSRRFLDSSLSQCGPLFLRGDFRSPCLQQASPPPCQSQAAHCSSERSVFIPRCRASCALEKPATQSCWLRRGCASRCNLLECAAVHLPLRAAWQGLKPRTP